MKEPIGAPQVVVGPVSDVLELARYICRKNHIHLFSGCRRYWTSRGWRMTKRSSSTDYTLLHIERAPLATVDLRWVAAGRIVIERSLRRIATDQPFAPP